MKPFTICTYQLLLYRLILRSLLQYVNFITMTYESMNLHCALSTTKDLNGKQDNFVKISIITFTTEYQK